MAEPNQQVSRIRPQLGFHGFGELAGVPSQFRTRRVRRLLGAEVTAGAPRQHGGGGNRPSTRQARRGLRSRLQVIERRRHAAARQRHAGDLQPHLAAGQGGGNPGVGGFQFYGHPRTIVEQVRRFHEAGVGILDIAFAPDAYGRGGTQKAMEAFASALPEIQRLSRQDEAVPAD